MAYLKKNNNNNNNWGSGKRRFKTEENLGEIDAKL